MMTHRVLAYLIGLALGYLVLTNADKQKGNTQLVGKAVAWIIMGVSLIAMLCIGYCSMKCSRDSADCPTSMSCPSHKEGWGGRRMMGHEGMMGGRDGEAK